MNRAAVSGAVMAYFAPLWASAKPTVELVRQNRKPATQTPDPAGIEASSWIRAYVSDIDGPRLYTFGGTLYSGGYLIVMSFTPIDVGSGYGDDLVDQALELVRGKTTGEVEFFPFAETFMGYVEESGHWWQTMGRVPFRVLDEP